MGQQQQTHHHKDTHHQKDGSRTIMMFLIFVRVSKNESVIPCWMLFLADFDHVSRVSGFPFVIILYLPVFTVLFL